MSYNLAQITIAAATNYTIPIISIVPADVSWVCVTNNSPFLLNTYVGIDSFIIPAWYYWPIQLDQPSGKVLPIKFSTLAGLGLSTPPFSWYTATIYGYGEKPPAGLNIPQSIQGQVNVGGGSLTTSTGGTQTQIAIDNLLINDANTAQTIIESTVFNSTNSNVSVDNQGNVTIGEYYSGAFTTLLQTISGTGVKLGAVSRKTEILGNLKPDGTLVVNGVTSVTNTGNIAAQTLSSSGAITAPGVTLSTGSLTRISTGVVTVPYNINVAVTHNLGATPDFVFATAATYTPTLYISHAIFTIGSTQFYIYQQNGPNSSLVFNWLAIKL